MAATDQPPSGGTGLVGGPSSEPTLVLRVKRRRDDEPLDSIVVEPHEKRPAVHALLGSLAGLHMASDSLAAEYQSDLKTMAADLPKPARKMFRLVESAVAGAKVDIASKLRARKCVGMAASAGDVKDAAMRRAANARRQARARQVAAHRGSVCVVEPSMDDLFTLVDIERAKLKTKKGELQENTGDKRLQAVDELLCNGSPMRREEVREVEDMYDYYVLEEGPDPTSADGGDLPYASITDSVFDELVFWSDDEEDEDYGEEDEDSNAEEYAGNDYPDEESSRSDDDFYEGEDYDGDYAASRAVQRHEYELSSEDEEDMLYGHFAARDGSGFAYDPDDYSD